MSEAIFGLLGTLVGGLVTFMVAWMRSSKELEFWKIKYSAEMSSDDIRRRLEHYASFTGALNKLLGDLAEIRDTISEDHESNKRVIKNIFEHDDFGKCSATLNSEKAWINLIAIDHKIRPKLEEIEDSFNKIITLLWHRREGQIKPSQKKEILSSIDELRRAYVEVLALLRDDVKNPLGQ